MSAFRSRLYMLALGALLGIGCFDAGALAASNPPLEGRIVVTGSSTLAPLVREIARRFESAHPRVRIDVQTGGTSRGIADIRRGTADVGMVSRPIGPDENDLAGHLIAIDGVSLIVHRDNPIRELSRNQVVDIATKRISRWNQVGGVDAPITFVNKAAGRATLELFLDFFKLEDRDIRGDVIIGDNLQGILTVAGNPHAIGYVSIGTAEYEAARGAPIKLLPMDGVEPTSANVLNGSFTLTRPLSLATHGEVSHLVGAFIEFASSGEVRDLVEAQFFVPVSE